MRVPFLPRRPRSLATVELVVERRYPDVDHVPVSDILGGEWRSAAFFDIRSAEEFAAGHIPGATRIPPGNTERWAEVGRPLIARRRCIFYCSVGERSSAMAAAVRRSALEAGASAAMNLRGGLFRWHQLGGPLTASGVSPARVHPFSPAWAPLLLPQGDS